MSSQIGVVNYKDLINNIILNKLKESVNNLLLSYKNLSSDSSVEKRESELYNDYINQYDKDNTSLSLLRKNAQDIVDYCNNALYTLTKRAIEHHIYEYDDLLDIENKTLEDGLRD